MQRSLMQCPVRSIPAVYCGPEVSEQSATADSKGRGGKDLLRENEQLVEGANQKGLSTIQGGTMLAIISIPLPCPPHVYGI